MKPGILASRAVAQYRNRDIFTHLALRYFLEAEVSLTDSYARTTAIQIVRGANAPAYLRVSQFKEIDASGRVEHRELHVPSAAEALAEASLLAECAKDSQAPNRDFCFSYWLSAEGDRSGYFEPYMVGLRARQRAVTRWIEDVPNCHVRYVDIQKFYPSISCDLAINAWRNFSERRGLSDSLKLLGEKLIDKHRIAGKTGSILTGPMFSHFLGNLVLSEVDKEISALSCRICRYVDDFVLVGSIAEIEHATATVADVLAKHGFSLHPAESPKSLTLTGEQWLMSARDFDSGDISNLWRTLVGDIKKLLILKKETAFSVRNFLAEDGFRIPIMEYRGAVDEASAFARVRELGLWSWLTRRTFRVSLETIRQDALRLRTIVEADLPALLGASDRDDAFQRKRLLSRIRFRLGRALYLGSSNSLALLLRYADDWPELTFHFSLIEAIISSNCDRVIKLGANVAQAAAQLFRATGETAIFEEKVTDEVSSAGLAIFIANGVSVRVADATDNDLLRLATGIIDVHKMQESQGFFQEFACLHGVGPARHSDILDTAFDLGQEVTFDALGVDYGYSI